MNSLIELLKPVIYNEFVHLADARDLFEEYTVKVVCTESAGAQGQAQPTPNSLAFTVFFSSATNGLLEFSRTTSGLAVRVVYRGFPVGKYKLERGPLDLDKFFECCQNLVQLIPSTDIGSHLTRAKINPDKSGVTGDTQRRLECVSKVFQEFTPC